MVESDFDKNVMFANWNTYYNDIANNIQRVTMAGSICLIEPDKIHEYYSLVVNMFYTYNFALENTQETEERLKKIEEKIFNKDFIIKIKQDKSDLIKIIRILRRIFSDMVKDFSDSGLIPKIKKTKKYNPGEAILN